MRNTFASVYLNNDQAKIGVKCCGVKVYKDFHTYILCKCRLTHYVSVTYILCKFGTSL